MDWRILLITCALAVMIGAGVLAEEAAGPAGGSDFTPSQAAGYSIGVQFGRRLQTLGSDVDVDMVKQGMADVLESKPLLMTEDQIRNSTRDLYMANQRRRVEELRRVAEKNKAEQNAFLEENKTKDAVTTLESGLQYKVIKSGKGESPAMTNRVKIRYTARLLNGTVVDSTERRGDVIETQVNKVVAAGMRQALLLMKPGDKWELYVPSELGYKMRPPVKDAEPNQLLVVELELLEVLPPPAERAVAPLPARPAAKPE